MWISKEEYDESGPGVVHRSAYLSLHLVRCCGKIGADWINLQSASELDVKEVLSSLSVRFNTVDH
jgi:hypothetical protein